MLKKNHKNSLHMENLQAPAFLAKSLSDENRLRILLCISDRKKSVSAIVDELQLSQPPISHHLKELRWSLLVKLERNGPFMYYELVEKRIIDILMNLDKLAMDTGYTYRKRTLWSRKRCIYRGLSQKNRKIRNCQPGHHLFR